jgi:hypothetical protein
MPSVSEIHLRAANVGGWMVFVEGMAEAWTNIPDLVGSGASSWIGTEYGAREVKLGLVMPGSLPFGETDPWIADIRSAQTTAFTLVDIDGTVVALFADQPDPATTYTLGERLSPLDDPAPDPANGLDGEIISLLDQHVGLERIGPDGERRHFWLAPDDVPPGLDHPAVSSGWPATQVTARASVFTGRKIAVYRIVQDPDTGLWPSWSDQYEGGSLWWFGTMTDNGRWSDQAGDERTKGRAFTFYAHGPASWLERSLNLARPTRWYKPTAGVLLTGNELLVAAWIEGVNPTDLGDGINYTWSGLYNAQTFESGNTLTGLTTREEIATKIYNIAKAMVDGGTYGGVDGTATNSVWTNPVTGPGSAGVWNDGTEDEIKRKVRISADGGTIEIRCNETEASRKGFTFCLALDVRVWELMGWFPFASQNFPGYHGSSIPVGGPNWGEAEGDQVLPPKHVIGTFTTRTLGIEQAEDEWDNNGSWKKYEAPYQAGTITLDHEGGTEIYLAVGDLPCEGQHGGPFTLGSQIDGTDVDASGWWLFRGQLLTAAAYEAGVREADEYMGVALCEWVSTSDGSQVEQNSEGLATLRIIRWEDPRRFGLPFDPLTEPWVNIIGGLEVAPLGVFGGIHTHAPGWRHRLIPSVLVSSGTSLWDDTGDSVTITPGVNHPGDLPASEFWAGDIEVADMGLGLPAAFVDWASWYTAAAQLPAGVHGAMNRVLYVASGSVKASQLLREAMAGAGWGWSCARAVGGTVPAFGAYNPLRPLSPADAVATLTRELMAEPKIDDSEPQWRGKVELRRGGPYDSFRIEAGRNPLGGDDPYVLGLESQDRDRRTRSGRIEWKVVDGGLRDPAPWLGTDNESLYDWTGSARERFASGFGVRLAAQLRIYRADYRAEVIPLLGLGSVVRVIDSTAESSDGTRGIDHMGRVTQYEIMSRGAANCVARVAVELERYPVAAVHVWGPYCYSGRGGWTSGTGILAITYNYAGAATGHSDTLGLTQPAWDTRTAGALRVTIYQSEDGETFDSTLTREADMVSVATEDSYITITNLTAALLRDTIKLVVATPLDDANQTAAWALGLFAPITTPGGTWDGGTQLGVRLK